MRKDTSVPAFPLADSCCEYRNTDRIDANGMTLRQYAAIKLKVPDSGIDWLDEMIVNSLKNDFAAKAMQALIEKTELMMQAVLKDGKHHGTPDEIMAIHRDGISKSACQYADAMLKAREA